AAGDLRRISRLHGGWRLPATGILAVGRLGDGAAGRVAGAALLVAQSPRLLADLHAERPPRRRSGRTGLPCLLLRGGGLCGMGRQAAADRSRMGACGALAAAARQRTFPRPPVAASALLQHAGRGAADVRRGVGMDPLGLRALSRLPPGGRRGRRVQRQVHGQPDGAARRVLRHAAGPYPAELPQLLPAGRALAVLRHPPRGRRIRGRMAPITLKRRSEAPQQAAADPGEAFAAAVHHGFSHMPKSLPAKFFYDRRGSELFERICELPEYYPTRTEIALLERHAEEIADAIGPDAALFEFGAGALRKVRILLGAMRDLVAYLPIDISGEHLQANAAALKIDHPGLHVAPIVADFTAGFDLPPLPPRARRVGFFPGSSIGNFTPEEARDFLRGAATFLSGGGLLIGVDLVKTPAILHAAYNDAAGVTAEFNRNLLYRIN